MSPAACQEMLIAGLSSAAPHYDGSARRRNAGCACRIRPVSTSVDYALASPLHPSAGIESERSGSNLLWWRVRRDTLATGRLPFFVVTPAGHRTGAVGA
jgi:hypothetical protein